MQLARMILKQYYLDCLAHASYLIADEAGGDAAVVDPQRDIDQYLAEARALGRRIGHVFLTHMHADFLAGHLELRAETGATIHLGARASAEYPHVAMADGEELALGRVRLKVLETPGHSPESISILVFDPDGDPTHPHAVLTGDTLFIGDVGRPDLRTSLGWTAEQLAGLLYDSLREKLLPLPDDTLVFPAHGAGSLCGRNLSTDTVSTIGVQRLFNYALQPMPRERFIEIITADQPDAPAYFTFDAVLNARERPTLDEALARGLRPLSLTELLELVEPGKSDERGHDGAVLLDTRDPIDFAAAHLRGALSVGLGGSFAIWCGTLLDAHRPVLLIAEPGRELEAATRLGRIGFDSVAGFLEGGMRQLEAAPGLLARVERVTPAALAEQLGGHDPPWPLDVRTVREWEEAHIEGSLHIPLARLLDYVGELDAERAFVAYCASGYRSTIAASVLRRAGIGRVGTLVGGLGAWQAAQLAVTAA